MIDTLDKIKIEIIIPAALVPYVKEAEGETMLFALMLYPLIQEGKLSYGEAANILGVNKMDLLDYYGEKELPYFTETPKQLENDVNKLLKDKRLFL